MVTLCSRTKVEVNVEGLLLTGRSPGLCLEGCRQVEEVVRVHRLVRSAIAYHAIHEGEKDITIETKNTTAVQRQGITYMRDTE